MLTSPQSRRALRSVIVAILMLGFLALVWRWADGDDTHWLIAVIAISVVGYQIENGVRSFKVGPDGIEAEGQEEK